MDFHCLTQSNYNASTPDELLESRALVELESLGNLDQKDLDELAKLCYVDPSDFNDFNLTSKQEKDRFETPTTEQELPELNNVATPASMSHSTQWGVAFFTHRNADGLQLVVHTIVSFLFHAFHLLPLTLRLEFMLSMIHRLSLHCSSSLKGAHKRAFPL